MLAFLLKNFIQLIFDLQFLFLQGNQLLTIPLPFAIFDSGNLMVKIVMFLKQRLETRVGCF
ncbi:hypothetical protein ABW07_12150 [Pluralibacter gergoviae]|nr:hypothetical protein ABW07_12150 [Pluralibacter gergoviae]